jgi:voltage-gated potassium channel
VPPPARGHRLRRRIYERLSLWRALALIFVLTAILVFGAALAERLVEPETFPTYGDALWWSVETVSTVGYGDTIPETGPGRIVAGVVMVFSMAFVPLVTSVVVSALVVKVQQRYDEAEGEGEADSASRNPNSS